MGPSRLVGTCFAYVGMFVFGGTAWVLQKTFWDGPCAFGRFVNLHVRSRKGQVDLLIRTLSQISKPSPKAQGP